MSPSPLVALLRRRLLASLLASLLSPSLFASGCADDADDALDCEPIGAERACSCDDGADGYQLCLASGARSACNCEVARVLPCAAPGVAFACSCEDGRAGMEICLEGGEYTPCDCDVAAAASDPGEASSAGADAAVIGQGDATSQAGAGAATGADTTACPTGFSCVEQMGFHVCADSTGFPPVCTTAADCAGAGLAAAECIDPGLGGVLVCAQRCQP